MREDFFVSLCKQNIYIMKNNKITIILIIIILLLIGGWFIHTNILKDKIDDANLEARIEKLRASKLEKISDVQSRKIVADSLTQRELNKRVKELEIALEAKPKIVWKTEFITKEIDKEVDEVSLDSNLVSVVDYYPKKEGYFVKYTNKIDLTTSEGKSNWQFNPITVSGVLSQREDGIYQIDFKHPDFMSIESIEVQATPLTEVRPDNFGFILGAGVGKDFEDNNTFFKVNGGIRYKKVYLMIGGTTNQLVDGSLNFEF